MTMESQKGYGPYPGGNNPFTCDFTVDGQKCQEPASRLYRTAFATKLICDGCAAMIQGAKGHLAATPIVEVSLLELIPARAELLLDLRLAQSRVSTLIESANRREAIERRVEIIRYWGIVVVLSAMIYAHPGWLTTGLALVLMIGYGAVGKLLDR
jgi:hypothetical protein